MDDVPEEITFLRWECELENDSLQVMRVQYLEGGLEFGTRTGDDELTSYSNPPLIDLKGSKLVVTVFSLEKSAIFDVSFFGTNGFRVLDEGGLTDIWCHYDKKKAVGLGDASLFRLSGHGWSKESFLSFFNNPFSWMISTSWDCVEVISANEPQVTLVKEIAGTKGSVPKDLIESLFDPTTIH